MPTTFAPMGQEIYADQHGREWAVRVTALLDGSLSPVGPFTPHGWTLPPYLLPPHDFVRPLPRTGAMNRCEVRYEPLIAMLQQAREEYDKLHDTLMAQKFGDALTADTPTPASVRRAVGDPPRAWQFMDAARQGNAWAVFGQGECPRKLRAFLPVERVTQTTWDDDDTDEDEALEPVGASGPADPVAARRARDAERKRLARAAAREEA